MLVSMWLSRFWSVVILKERTWAMALGIYGLVLGCAIVVALIAGGLDLELHGFRVITLTQAIWFIAAGIFLWRSEIPVTSAAERVA